MNNHFSDLKQIPSEFQRQMTSRFIEGISDSVLRQKLRRHCKREKNNIDEAYQFAVDYESSNVAETSTPAPRSLLPSFGAFSWHNTNGGFNQPGAAAAASTACLRHNGEMDP